MLRPYTANVTLPPELLQLLKDYYHDLYGIQKPIGPTIQQYGRLQLSSEVYGATISS